MDRSTKGRLHGKNLDNYEWVTDSVDGGCRRRRNK